MNVHTACSKKWLEVVLSGRFDFSSAEERIVELFNYMISHKCAGIMVDFSGLEGELYRTQEQILGLTASVLIHRHYTLHSKRFFLALVTTKPDQEEAWIALRKIMDQGVQMHVTRSPEEARSWLANSLK